MSILTEHLHRFAIALDASSNWGNPPALVRIIPDGDGADLGVRPVDDGYSVVDVLSGFVAPDEWEVLGVITEGNARNDTDADFAKRVRCVHLVHRDGTSASTLHLQDEPVMELEPGQSAEGRIDDVCRRALGLPTAPALRTTIELWAALWLGRLLTIDITERITWRQVAELHPAIGPVADEPRAIDLIVSLGWTLSEVHPWSSIRAACAADEWSCDDVSADVAKWLDDGSFSRWVMGGFPRMDEMTAQVAEWLPADVFKPVLATLREWDLLQY